MGFFYIIMWLMVAAGIVASIAEYKNIIKIVSRFIRMFIQKKRKLTYTISDYRKIYKRRYNTKQVVSSPLPVKQNFKDKVFATYQKALKTAHIENNNESTPLVLSREPDHRVVISQHNFEPSANSFTTFDIDMSDYEYVSIQGQMAFLNYLTGHQVTRANDPIYFHKLKQHMLYGNN